MTKKTFFFVGSFDLEEDHTNSAASAAGNQVQSEILTALQASVAGEHQADINAILLKPLRSWPRGQFIWRGRKMGKAYFPPFVNLARVKQAIFSISLLLALVKIMPRFVVKYNAGLSDALVLRLYKRLNPKSYIACVLQDVHCRPNSWLQVGRLGDFLAMRILRALDALVPISKRIRDDFHFDPAKTIVFSGGLTRQGRELMRRGSGEIKLYAVFAGALEKYNGIDRLVERWSGSGLDMDLHVFGRGSCEAIVRAASNRCPRIVFHGFQPEAEVTEWQARALATFCLRYSFGIDACYFFPSKLINALSAPGAVVVNSFDGFPACLADACFMIDDNLDCLEDCIASIRPNDALEKQRLQRRKWLREECDWQTLIQELVGRARLRETFL